jgi:predicted TIM-barrel fold metal-dependent hydrolase
MAKLAYFDCNCCVGRVAYPLLHDISGTEGLIREMDTAGVEEALVFHTVARDSDPVTGNRMLLDEIAGNDRLHPVWVVLPHHTGEMPVPGELLKDIAENGVRAVRMYPTGNSQGFSLADWNAGALLGALAEAAVPLMLDIEIAGWESVADILKRYTTLPLIVVDANYRHNRFSYPLFEQYDNFHLELSRHFGAGIIEDIVARFGSERLLFGTNMPQYTGSAAVSLLTYSEVSRADKENIAGDNLRRLLGRALS